MNVLLVSALERSGVDRTSSCSRWRGNAGTALGAVLHAWHSVYDGKQRVSLGDLCLGPSFAAEDIKQVLENCKLRFRYLLTTGELLETAVQQLNDNKIVAWMQGRMEFGPRALGNRSILASPLDPYSTREPEHLHQAPRAVPQVRRLGAGGACRRVLRGRAERPLPGDRGPREGRASRDVRGRGARRRHGPRPHREPGGQPAVWTSCCTRPASGPGCRCSTTRRSTCSATRWSARRGMRCAASTPPASTRCSSVPSCSRSRLLGRRLGERSVVDWCVELDGVVLEGEFVVRGAPPRLERDLDAFDGLVVFEVIPVGDDPVF